ncbi:MAG: GxxExxY protein [Candidatus Paceibacterota bacterium]|jgi:GxxExxY protein
MQNKKVGEKVIFPELSYIVNGILFSVHNELGRFAREKQYSDLLEGKLKEIKLPYKRELSVSDSGNIIDFIIDNKIVIEIKAIRFLTKDSYRQIQNYLQQTGFKLGFLVNFRSEFLKIVRIINISE